MLELSDSEATHRYYPYAFRLDETYRLSHGMLTISYEVTAGESNAGTMPFSIGNHLTFKLPFVAGTDPAAMTFASPNTTELLRNPSGFGLSGKTKERSFASPQPLSDVDAHVALPLAGYHGQAYAVLRDPQGLAVRITQTASSEVPEPLIRFNINGGPAAGYLGTEPWFGMQNSLNLHKGAVELGPGKSWRWQLQLDPEKTEAQPKAVVQTTTTSKIIDWPTYGGHAGNDHYSPLMQINRKNVRSLHTVWTYDTGEDGSLETTPVVVGNMLFGYTPSLKVIALDARTGKLLWRFDPGFVGTQPARGVSYWSDGKEQRIFAGIMSYLYALDPNTGKPIPSFGDNGRVDLRKGLGGDYERQSVALTSPGAIYKDLIIVGGRNPETHPAPPGYIRAFDVRTGALRWEFHTIPKPGEAGYETWPKDAWKNGAGAANNWAGMSVDTKRGIVYVPTGSSVFDFYGGDRVGDDLYADTLLALDAATGKRIWYFQGVHHDLWDRDFPSPPTLLTVTRDGKRIDAIAQTTKHGYLFVFDRATGKPIFPIEEHKYPKSDIPGEVTSPTQPYPVLPAAYSRQSFTPDMATNRTPEAHAAVLNDLKKYRSEGLFVPFSIGKSTVLQPGFGGGAEWGGSAADPKGILYVNATDIPMGLANSTFRRRRIVLASRFIRPIAASAMAAAGPDRRRPFLRW